MISNARIIDESQLDTSKILIHSIVKIKNTTNGMEFSYTLVADSETDIRNGKTICKLSYRKRFIR